MGYVRAWYGIPDPIRPEWAPKGVFAEDERGTVWSLTEDSQVGDWLRYIEGGGTIDPAPEARVKDDRA